jgi:hypothetical protein
MKKKPDPPRDLEERIEGCLKRIASRTEAPFFREMLSDLVRNNAIPPELLEAVPERAEAVSKTRFDQLYDAAMFLAFPTYSEKALKRLLGPDPESPDVKIWRAMFPPKFGLAHVLIRAKSFQEAFSLGCDYACRLSLMLYRKIPADLTVRIQFVSDKGIRRMLDVRNANKLNKRKKLQLVGRVHSFKEVMGARAVALGPSGKSGIARYAEASDLKRILKKKNVVRVTAIETETFRKRK